MKTYLIPVTNSYEYDYCNYVIVKSETPSDAYHAAYTKRLRFNSWSFLFCKFFIFASINKHITKDFQKNEEYIKQENLFRRNYL